MLQRIFRVSRDLFARQQSFATVLNLIPTSSDTLESEEVVDETILKVVHKNTVNLEGILSSSKNGLKVVILNS